MIHGMNEEQNLCKLCGLCCDGTLYDRVHIKDPADLYLVKSLDYIVTKEVDGISFKQPCPYFSNCCSVYNSINRPHTCRTYHCKLLKKYQKELIDFNTALNIVQATKSKAEELRNLQQSFDGFRYLKTIFEFSRAILSLNTDTKDETFGKRFSNCKILSFSLNETLNRHFRDLKNKGENTP